MLIAGSVDADVSNTVTELQGGDWLMTDRSGTPNRIAYSDLLNSMRGVIQEEAHPVGSVMISANPANPSTYLSITSTWVQVAAGRAIVGAGTSNTADATTWALKQERGLETHTLQGDEIPTHAHAYSGTTSSNGLHSHGLYSGQSNSGTVAGLGQGNAWFMGASENLGPNIAYYTRMNANTGAQIVSFEGDHAHTYSGTTTTVGSFEAHNNLQPSIAYYVWERTA